MVWEMYMTKKRLTIGSKPFEELKKINAYAAEYWSARELQTLLGYQQWRTFVSAIKRAMNACKQMGSDPNQHFAMIKFLADNEQKSPDYHLSRFACYLIAQNGDSRKPEIAEAQKYFAIQARRQEMSEEMAADLERLYVRKQATKLFKALSGAASHAGVQNEMFRTFHDAGYRGLYGGLSSEAIKALKKIPREEKLLDRMGTTELAANQFRMTQTRDKLAKEKINNPLQAILIHQLVGQEVRQAIERIGGTPPEKLAPAEHIKQVEKRVRQASHQLILPSETLGLLSG